MYNWALIPDQQREVYQALGDDVQSDDEDSNDEYEDCQSFSDASEGEEDTIEYDTEGQEIEQIRADSKPQ